MCSAQDKTFRTSPILLLDDITPLVSKLHARKRVPPKIMFRNLESVDPSKVVRLHSSAFDIDDSEALCRMSMRSKTINYDRRLSTTLWNEEILLGAVFLYTVEAKWVFFYGMVVGHKWRRSWVTPILKHHVFEILVNEGVTILDFRAMRGNKDTLSHAKRVSACQIEEV